MSPEAERTPLPASTYTLYKSPNPDWTFAQKVSETAEGKKWLEGLKAGWTTIDPSQEEPRKVYGLLLSGIAPRPIAFVSTISATGTENLAPFSWFNQVSARPAVISIACTTTPNWHTKDTAKNVKANPGFTVNIISEPWVEQANVCSVDAPEDVGEWPFSGLTKEPSTLVKAARVRESAFSMECELLQTVDIKDPKTGAVASTLILATIKLIHIRNDTLNDRGVCDAGKLKPVGRAAGISYTRVTDAYELPRPVWQEIPGGIRNTLSGAEANL